jgi:uncharacterized protein YndB with AHSA1/START domain
MSCMTKTIPTSIEREIHIQAPIDVVWRTVTEPELIPLWFSDKAAIEVQPGGRGELVFTDSATTEQMSAPIVVQVVEPPTAFSFRWGHADGDEPAAGNSMLVEFTLRPDGDNTWLRVVETGHTTMDWPDDQKEAYATDHTHGWEVHFGRLQDHFATR